MAFSADSRYSDVPDRTLVVDGTTHVYKAIRVIGRSERLTTHVVRSGERPDHVSFVHFRDPELFWQIADANSVVDPNELVDPPGGDITIPRER